MKAMYKSPHYKRWCWARHITRNPNHPEYFRYGARGIQLNFKNFWEYHSYIVNKLGPRPSPKHQICRINKQGHYEPGNIDWQLPIERSNSNTQQNIRVKYRNKTQTLADWSRQLSIPYYTLRRRIADGKSIKEVVKEFQ